MITITDIMGGFEASYRGRECGGVTPTSTFNYVSHTGFPLRSGTGSNVYASYAAENPYPSGSPLPESSTITYYVPGLPAISFSLTFTTNTFGELTELNINNAHTLTYTRDGLGRVTKVTRSAGAAGVSSDLVKSILYQPNGSLMRMLDGNSILTDYYQLYGWGVPSCTSVYNLRYTNGPDRSASTFYAVAPAAIGGTDPNRRLWTDQDLVWSGGKFQADNHLNPHLQNVGPDTDGLNQFNTYDRESQLVGNTALSAPYKKDLIYSYDPLHNRTQQVQHSKVGSQWILTATTNYAYDATTNRIKSATLVNSKYPAPGNTKYYYHDARGNLTATTVTASVLPSDTSGTFVTHSYAYDLMNHLVSADSGRVRFSYLANGMKYLKLTEPTLDGSTLIPPRATLYFYGPSGELIYEATYNRSTGNRISDTYYFHAAGLLVGELTSGNLNTPAFVSRQYDNDVGLYYLNARWYDPQLGRFVSVDPIPSSLNQYAYANNNPLVFSDPEGLLSKYNVNWSLNPNDSGPPSYVFGVDPESPGVIFSEGVIDSFGSFIKYALTAQLLGQGSLIDPEEQRFNAMWTIHQARMEADYLGYNKEQTDEFIKSQYMSQYGIKGMLGITPGPYAYEYDAMGEQGRTYYAGELAGTLLLIACPSGRRGGPAHRARIADLQTKLEGRGWNLASGGNGPEALVKMAWRNRGRFPDLVMEKGARRIAIQVGEREGYIRPGYKYRLPVSREVDAMNDLIRSHEFKYVYFMEK